MLEITVRKATPPPGFYVGATLTRIGQRRFCVYVEADDEKTAAAIAGPAIKAWAEQP